MHLLLGTLHTGYMSAEPSKLSHAAGATAMLEATEPDTEEGDAPAARAETATEQGHWVRFRVLDDATGPPYANVRLRIKVPGGGSQDYVTDSDGSVYVDELAAGICDIERIIADTPFEVVAVV